jgi:hypothetical protein
MFTHELRFPLSSTASITFMLLTASVNGVGTGA